jgi:hypothetical protein
VEGPQFDLDGNRLLEPLSISSFFLLFPDLKIPIPEPIERVNWDKYTHFYWYSWIGHSFHIYWEISSLRSSLAESDYLVSAIFVASTTLCFAAS